MLKNIYLFRENPDIIRESQRRRFASVDLVDEIIKLDKEWRQGKFELDGIRKDFNKLNKEVAKLKISGAEATEQIQQIEIIKQRSTEKEATVGEVYAALEAKLESVPNLVHDSVPIDNDEANNRVIIVWGDQTRAALLNHVDLVERLGYVETEGGKQPYVKGAKAKLIP